MFRFTDNVIMQLTKDCNMHCTYCFQGNKKEWCGKYVNFETFKQLVDTVIFYRCVLGKVENYVNFHFHGGEVTMIPKETLIKMMDYIIARKCAFPGITFCIQTNGSNLDKELCEYFASKNINPGVSFDGFHSTERMSIEGNKKLISKLEKLNKETNCKFGILSVLTNNNIKTWYSDMKTLDPNIFTFGLNVLVSNDDSLIPSAADQWNYWINPVLKSYLTDNPFRERNIENAVTKALTEIIFEVDRPKMIKTGCFDRLCGHGANMLAVDPNLNIFACDKYLEDGKYIEKKKYVHITQRDFLGMQQINKCIQYYKKIQKLEKEFHCDACKARWICPGDCQAANISKYGEYKLNKNLCEYYKKAFDFIRANWIKIAENETNIVGSCSRIRSTALDELEKNNKKLIINNGTYKVVNK